MSKRVEFHQAQIVVDFRIVDEERSHGLKRATVTLLMDTEQEWAAAREEIERARVQLGEQLANSD